MTKQKLIQAMTIEEWIDRFKTIDNFEVVDVDECAELISYLEELKKRREREEDGRE